MANNKVMFSSGNSSRGVLRRGTEDTESDYQSMHFEDRTIVNFTMNPTIKKVNEGGPVSMPMNRKSSTTALFKVILLGDSLVGKSSIVMRLVVNLIHMNIILERIIFSGASTYFGFRFCKVIIF